MSKYKVIRDAEVTKAMTGNKSRVVMDKTKKKELAKKFDVNIGESKRMVAAR
jgi:uncharacterized protein YdaL